MEKKTNKKKLTKEEFRKLMPEKLNKLGEWLLEHYNDEPWDAGMTPAERRSCMRAIMK